MSKTSTDKASTDKKKSTHPALVPTPFSSGGFKGYYSGSQYFKSDTDYINNSVKRMTTALKRTGLKNVGKIFYQSNFLIAPIEVKGDNDVPCLACNKVHRTFNGACDGNFLVNCHIKADVEENITYYCFGSGKSIVLFNGLNKFYYDPDNSKFVVTEKPSTYIGYIRSVSPVRVDVKEWSLFTHEEVRAINKNKCKLAPYPMMDNFCFYVDPKLDDIDEIGVYIKKGKLKSYDCPLCGCIHDEDHTEDSKFPELVLVKWNDYDSINDLAMLCKCSGTQVYITDLNKIPKEPEQEEEAEDEPGSVPEPEKKKKQKIIVFDNLVKVLGIKMEGPKFTDFSKSTKTIKDLLKLETQLEEKIDEDTVIKITELTRNVMTRVGANKGYVIARNINGEYQSYNSRELSDLLGRRDLYYQPSKPDANPIKTSFFRLATNNSVLETNFKGFTCDLYLPGITKPPKDQKEGYLNSYVPIKRKYISKDIRDTSDENLFIRLIQYVICGDADPKLMKELYHYTDTAEQYSTLYEIFCYTLAYIRRPAQSLANGKHTNTKKMLIMHEPKGGAGKSAISTSIQAIFGDSLTTIEPHIGTLTGTHSNFSGKVYIFVDDCEKGTTPNTKVAVSQLKSTITTEAITVNPKGIQSYKVPYYGNIVLLTNTTKLFGSPDSALQRRTIVIPCTKAESKESKRFFTKIYGILEGNEEGRLEEFCDNVYSWFLDYNEEFDDIDFNDNDKFPIPTSQASNDMFAIADGTIGLYFNKLKKGDRFTHEQVDYDNTKDIDKTVRISKIGGFDTYVIRPQDLYKDYKEYCEDRERKMQPETETKFYASKEYIGNTEPHNVKVSGKKVLCRILHRVVCKKGKCDCKCRIHYIPDKPEEEYEEESEEDHSEKVEKRTVKEKKRKFVVVDSDED